MHIIVFEDYQQMSRAAARVFASQIMRKPNSVLGFATGSSPEGTYAELVRLHREENLDWRRVTTFNLDEYVGLPPTHDQSYRYFMDQQLFSHVNIPLEQTHLINGCAQDIPAECLRYEKAIEDAGGIDLQLLGIGRNGHIGFNEPADSFSPITLCVQLTQDTLDANVRYFPNLDEMPKQALSMGIGSIMNAREIVLVASGRGKALAVRQMVKGPVVPQMPASILQFHQHVTIMCDREAAAEL